MSCTTHHICDCKAEKLAALTHKLDELRAENLQLKDKLAWLKVDTDNEIARLREVETWSRELMSQLSRAGIDEWTRPFGHLIQELRAALTKEES